MKAFVLVMALLLAVSFAIAAREETQQAGKNMTFGQCVSAAADAKNACYSNAETQRKTCEQGNETSTCKQTYKQAKDQCKKDFKAAKKECGKIKHSAWEGFKASFK